MVELTRERASTIPVEENEDFLIPLEKRTYQQQYANIYYMRLELQRSALIKAAQEAWSSMTVDGHSVKYVKKALEIEPETVSWVVGTVYRELSYKPNILDEVTASHYGAPPKRHEKYVGGEGDSLLLEDESGRLNLVGDFIQRQLLVTGAVIAVLGTENSKGDFHVMDMKTAGLAPQVARFKRSESASTKYVAIASGLDLGTGSAEHHDWRMLQEYLTGEIGGERDQTLASKISMLILAGDSVVSDSTKAEETLKKTQQEMPVAFKFEHPPLHEWPIDELDGMLAELCQSLPVSIMPGELDPATAGFPQQPLHPSLFTKSKSFRKANILSLTTNPHWWNIEGVRFLGTGGQPINDIYKYTLGNDRISIMEACLKWRHMAPTAPDTLWSYPFVDGDPYVLKETPHVYFAGNQPYYDTKYVQEDDGRHVRIISIPKFSSTGEFVLVNLDTLDCTLVSCK